MENKFVSRKENGLDGKTKIARVLIDTLLLLVLLSLILQNVVAIPVGPVTLFNSTTNSSPRPALAITTAGGTFTTLVLNTTGQTYKWKAYVGNVSGKLTLADSTNKSIFDWTVTSVSGEVYATRSSSAVDWTTVGCADDTLIGNEDSFMNMTLNAPDSINKTFNSTIHKSFYVGGVKIQNSSCRAIATYVNGARQTPSESAVFQEILLKDGTSDMIYTTLMNSSTIGYNNNRYDFQMIVAENEYQVSPTTYYLYVELI